MSHRLLALAIATLLAISGGLIIGDLSGGGTGDRLADGTTTTTMRPGTLAEVVRELQEFVAERRGLAFEHDVDVILLDDDRFEARLLRDAEEDRDEIEVTGRLMRAVGLLDADVDLYAVLLRYLGSAVAGFYDPESDELVVRGGGLSPYARSTLVHELTHALDDQWFDLHRPELDEGDERSLAFGALVEGDAVRVEQAYRGTFTDAERLQAGLEQQQQASRIDRRGLPDAIPKIIGFPYLFGPRFVGALVERGGEDLVNRTFERPPTTSEHILHPERWFDDEPVRSVARPEAEGAVLDEGLYGQSSLQLTLEPVVGTEDADRAADGWGGDRYVVWDAGGGRTCVRARFAMDTADDLDELTRALRAWARERDAHVEQERGTVTFTSCS